MALVAGDPDAYPEALVRVLGGYFGDAAERMKSLILHPKSEAAATRAAGQLRQVDEALADLGQKMSGWVGKHIPAAYRDGQERADRQAKEAGVNVEGRAVEGSFDKIDFGAVKKFAEDSIHDLHKGATGMVNQAKRILRKTSQEKLSEAEINRILAGGVIDGKPADTIRQLRTELQRVYKDGLVEITDKNGDLRHYDAAGYAEMVVRTKTREATVAARHERLASMGIDLVRVIGRVSKNICTEFVGHVYSLSGRSDKYPPLPPGGPPWHPNCTKSTAPFVEDMATEKQLEVAAPDEDSTNIARILAEQGLSAAQKAFSDTQGNTRAFARYGQVAPVVKRVGVR